MHTKTLLTLDCDLGTCARGCDFLGFFVCQLPPNYELCKKLKSNFTRYGQNKSAYQTGPRDWALDQSLQRRQT